MYKSQFNQDSYLNKNFFNNKKNGVFVDIGAHDGVNLSNTYFYEKELKWRGLCVEANPSIFEQLKQNRKCLLVNGCAWHENTVKKFRKIDGPDIDMLSGLVDSYCNKHEKRIDNELEQTKGKYKDIDVNCYNLTELLENNNLTEIDFLSIDTEGSELEILEHLDFEKIDTKILLVENNYEDKKLRKLLKNKGYKFYTRLVIDDIFIKDYDEKVNNNCWKKLRHKFFANWRYVKNRNNCLKRLIHKFYANWRYVR